MLHNKITLSEFLEQHAITQRKCFEIANVNRTTFKRWLKGETYPPAATIELLKLYAQSNVATLPLHWQGWCFNDGKLYTPANRGFEPYQIEELPHLYRDRAMLNEINKNYALQSKLL